MLPGMELIGCQHPLAVPKEVMHHVIRVESSYNPYAIGVVGGRLVRQPRSLAEAVSTARMLEERGYNFSVGLAQVNRYNLAKYGLHSYEKAFEPCSNVVAGSRILAECYHRAQDWGKSFSCYYSGDFKTGYRHGYVQKVFASMRKSGGASTPAPVQSVAMADRVSRRVAGATALAEAARQQPSTASLAARRGGVSTAQSNVPEMAALANALAAQQAQVAVAQSSAAPIVSSQTAAETQIKPPVVVAAQRLGSPPHSTSSPLPAAAMAPAVQAVAGSDNAFVF